MDQNFAIFILYLIDKCDRLVEMSLLWFYLYSEVSFIQVYDLSMIGMTNKNESFENRALISAVELSSTAIVWYSNLSGQWFGQFGLTLRRAVIPSLSRSSSWPACAAEPRYKWSAIFTGTPYEKNYIFYTL